MQFPSTNIKNPLRQVKVKQDGGQIKHRVYQNNLYLAKFRLTNPEGG